MNFDDKIKFICSLAKFKVTPISEVRAIAFVAKEKLKPEKKDFVLEKTKHGYLTLSIQDIQKILREYPELKPKLIYKNLT